MQKEVTPDDLRTEIEKAKIDFHNRKVEGQKKLEK